MGGGHHTDLTPPPPQGLGTPTPRTSPGCRRSCGPRASLRTEPWGGGGRGGQRDDPPPRLFPRQAAAARARGTRNMPGPTEKGGGGHGATQPPHSPWHGWTVSVCTYPPQPPQDRWTGWGGVLCPLPPPPLCPSPGAGSVPLGGGGGGRGLIYFLFLFPPPTAPSPSPPPQLCNFDPIKICNAVRGVWGGPWGVPPALGLARGALGALGGPGTVVGVGWVYRWGALGWGHWDGTG